MIWLNTGMDTEVADNDEPMQMVLGSEPQRVPYAAIAKVKHMQADGVYIKCTLLPKNVKFWTKRTGDDHIAILAAGEAVIEDGDTRTKLVAPASTVIPGDHRIRAYTLTDCVFYCVHATAETDLTVLDKIY